MSQHRKNLSQAVAQKSGGKVGEFEAMLDEEDREELHSFLEWFKVQRGNKGDFVTSASVSSYKSYLSKVWALEIEDSDLTSDQRSGVRKYNEFCAWRDRELERLGALEDEDEDEDIDPEVFPGDTEI